jgi:hypothetical protein
LYIRQNLHRIPEEKNIAINSLAYLFNLKNIEYYMACSALASPY